jgi:hypothetical protein
MYYFILGTAQYKVPVFNVINVASGKYLTADAANSAVTIQDAIANSDTQKW